MEGGLVSSCAGVVGADVSQALGCISGATSQGRGRCESEQICLNLVLGCKQAGLSRRVTASSCSTSVVIWGKKGSNPCGFVSGN